MTKAIGKYQRIWKHSDEVFREFYRCETNNFDARCMIDFHKTLLQRGFDAEAYIKEEFNWIRSFLTPNNYTEYLEVERKGRKLPMLAQQREQVLEGIDGWIKKMRSVGVADTPMITHRVFDFEDKIKPEIDFTLVDEVQDLGTLELRLIRAITKTGVNDLFLVGDVAQSVLAKHLSLKSAGIDYEDRQLQLKLNYRNTREILEAAYQVMYQNLDDTLLDTEDFEFLDPEYANRCGEKPYLLPTKNLKQEISNSITLAQEISNTNAEGKNRKIGVIICGYTNLEVANFAEENGLTSLQNNLDFRESNVFFSDLESSKGFEFDDVIIVNCNSTSVPPKGVPDEEAFRMGCQLYVAMTRAKTRLFISYSGECSRWIQSEIGYFSEASWEDFIDENEQNSIALPQKLPEVINASDDGDNAVFNLTGSLFVYTRFAIGVERRILDWLDRNVAGVSGFREGQKGVRNKWENLQQLYNDLKRNQTTSTVPYFFSPEGDKELLELFEHIEISPKGNWKTKPIAAVSAGRASISSSKGRRHKSNKSKIKTLPRLENLEVKALPLQSSLKNFYKKQHIYTVSQAKALSADDYRKEPSLNKEAIQDAKLLEEKAIQYLNELKERQELEEKRKQLEKQQEAREKHPRNTLSEKDKNAIWLMENSSTDFDPKSIQQLTGISTKNQEKLRKLARKYSSPEMRVEPHISHDEQRREIAQTLKRREAARANRVRIESSQAEPGVLPKYNAYEDK